MMRLCGGGCQNFNRNLAWLIHRIHHYNQFAHHKQPIFIAFAFIKTKSC